MRRSASPLVAAAVALLLSGCVPNSEVPPVGTPLPSPTPTPYAAAPAMQAVPSSLTIGKSSYPAGGMSYPSVTVSQPGANSAPDVIAAQSTCMTNGNASIYSTSSSGSATTVQVQPLVIGQCVIEFGGVDGVTLIVPVTITN